MPEKSAFWYVPDADAPLTPPKATESAHGSRPLRGPRAPGYSPHPDTPYPPRQKAGQLPVPALRFYNRSSAPPPPETHPFSYV